MSHQDLRFYQTMRLLGIITFAAFALASVAIFYAHSTTEHAVNQNRVVLRAIVCDIEHEVLIKNDGDTLAQIQARAFYTHLLAHDINAKPC